MDMGPRAQVLARDAGAMRKLLADVPLLARAGGTMTLGQAGNFGCKVLHENAGVVELGISEIPAVSARVLTSSPKGA